MSHCSLCTSAQSSLHCELVYARYHTKWIQQHARKFERLSSSETVGCALYSPSARTIPYSLHAFLQNSTYCTCRHFFQRTVRRRVPGYDRKPTESKTLSLDYMISDKADVRQLHRDNSGCPVILIRKRCKSHSYYAAFGCLDSGTAIVEGFEIEIVSAFGGWSCAASGGTTPTGSSRFSSSWYISYTY